MWKLVQILISFKGFVKVNIKGLVICCKAYTNVFGDLLAYELTLFNCQTPHHFFLFRVQPGENIDYDSVYRLVVAVSIKVVSHFRTDRVIILFDYLDYFSLLGIILPN